MKISTAIAEADLVIIINNQGIKVIKDRYKDIEIIDLPELIHRIIPYQKDYLHDLLESFVTKLKLYRIFS